MGSSLGSGMGSPSSRSLIGHPKALKLLDHNILNRSTRNKAQQRAHNELSSKGLVETYPIRYWAKHLDQRHYNDPVHSCTYFWSSVKLPCQFRALTRVHKHDCRLLAIMAVS